MDELIKEIEAARERLAMIRQALAVEDKERQIFVYKNEMESPVFWENRAHATAVARKVSNLERALLFWQGAWQRAGDLLQIARDDKTAHDVSLREELEKELRELKKEIDAKESEVWLSGEHDAHPAIVTIYSGAGGVDAQDWALMLERMYLKFAVLKGYETAILQRTVGNEAGIKNVTIRFDGPFAYGYLKAESGVHRLVRLSPFDADQARHTSFAMVEVLPELEEPGAVDVSKDDVRIDVFRSSGHGGQSVNTTDSAVRLTHIPTGITVSCQNERSQMQNKDQAWKILLGKLERYYALEREEERQALRGEFTEAAWGNQIRSYVLHPYKLVKDHRTKLETKNPDAVLAGDLMPFIEAELQRLVKKNSDSNKK